MLVCYHVLEHVPDDAAAMRELARVLAPGGVGLVQVPIRFGMPTDEDLSADEAERVRRFGQHDHVRYYGDDFEQRLVDAGLVFTRVSPRSLVGERVCTVLGLIPDEWVWVVRSSVHAEGEVAPARRTAPDRADPRARRGGRGLGGRPGPAQPRAAAAPAGSRTELDTRSRTLGARLRARVPGRRHLSA